MCIIISTTEEHACFLEVKGIILSHYTVHDIFIALSKIYLTGCLWI